MCDDKCVDKGEGEEEEEGEEKKKEEGEIPQERVRSFVQRPNPALPYRCDWSAWPYSRPPVSLTSSLHPFPKFFYAARSPLHGQEVWRSKNRSAPCTLDTFMGVPLDSKGLEPPPNVSLLSLHHSSVPRFFHSSSRLSKNMTSRCKTSLGDPFYRVVLQLLEPNVDLTVLSEILERCSPSYTIKRQSQQNKHWVIMDFYFYNDAMDFVTQINRFVSLGFTKDSMSPKAPFVIASVRRIYPEALEKGCENGNTLVATRTDESTEVRPCEECPEDYEAGECQLKPTDSLEPKVMSSYSCPIQPIECDALSKEALEKTSKLTVWKEESTQDAEMLLKIRAVVENSNKDQLNFLSPWGLPRFQNLSFWSGSHMSWPSAVGVGRPCLSYEELNFKNSGVQIRYPLSQWCEHADHQVQLEDYRHLVRRIGFTNRYVFFQNLAPEISDRDAFRDYLVSQHFGKSNFQVIGREMVFYQKSHPRTVVEELFKDGDGHWCAHVAFRTKREAQTAIRLLSVHVKKLFDAMELSGPRRASHTLWIGNFRSCERLAFQALADLFRLFQGLQHLRFIPEKNCVFATYETVESATLSRNFLHGLLFGVYGNQTRLNVDFTFNKHVEVGASSNLKKECFFCSWRRATQDLTPDSADWTNHAPYLIVPGHVSFFIHHEPKVSPSVHVPHWTKSSSISGEPAHSSESCGVIEPSTQRTNEGDTTPIVASSSSSCPTGLTRRDTPPSEETRHECLDSEFCEQLNGKDETEKKNISYPETKNQNSPLPENHPKEQGDTLGAEALKVDVSATKDYHHEKVQAEETHKATLEICGVIEQSYGVLDASWSRLIHELNRYVTESSQKSDEEAKSVVHHCSKELFPNESLDSFPPHVKKNKKCQRPKKKKVSSQLEQPFIDHDGQETREDKHTNVTSSPKKRPLIQTFNEKRRPKKSVTLEKESEEEKNLSQKNRKRVAPAKQPEAQAANTTMDQDSSLHMLPQSGDSNGPTNVDGQSGNERVDSFVLKHTRQGKKNVKAVQMSKFTQATKKNQDTVKTSPVGEGGSFERSEAELKEEKTQLLDSLTKHGTCQLAKQGQYLCIVAYYLERGDHQITPPDLMNISARTTMSILKETMDRKSDQFTVWKLLPVSSESHEVSPYKSLCDYFTTRHRIGLLEAGHTTIFIVPLMGSTTLLNIEIKQVTLFAFIFDGCLLKPKQLLN